jgi:hypothetical protein
LIAAMTAIAKPADPRYSSISNVVNVVSSYNRRRRLSADNATSAHLKSGISISFTLVTLWDLRGRTTSLVNYSTSDAVCDSMTSNLAAYVDVSGTTLVSAIRAAAQAASVSTLYFVTVNTSEAILGTECISAHVPVPTVSPTMVPTPLPTLIPTPLPTYSPTPPPSPVPTQQPTPVPTYAPSPVPTPMPTSLPSSVPSPLPSQVPTSEPTSLPTSVPTHTPTPLPTSAPTTVLRGYQQCVCVTAGVARKLKSWCPSIAHRFDGESCLANVTTVELYDLVAECPPLQTTFFSD